MNVQKILGFALIAGGIGIILYSLYASFTFFTGSATPPEIFSLSAMQTEEKNRDTSLSLNPQDLPLQLTQLLQGQLKGLVLPNTVPIILNFTIWSMFAGLLMLGGGQIAGIGIKLLK